MFNQYLKKIFSYAFVFLCNCALTKHIFAHILAKILKIMTVKQNSLNSNHGPVLFALSWNRIKIDAECLAKSGYFKILHWPDRVQFFIQLRFLNELSYTPHHARHENTKQQRMETQLRDFLNLMFPIFLKKLSAKAVIGANFWYKQDFRFGEAAQKNNVPYIVLFKESLKISETEKKALFDLSAKLERFSGEKILVHNNTVAQILTESEYCRPDQIAVTGAIRMASFIEKCKTGTSRKLTKTNNGHITLFSFTPGISLNGLAIPPWPNNPYHGWVRLFEAVHSCFAEAAMKNTDRNFIIKTKYGGRWHNRIRDACLARDIDIDRLDNLKIVDDVNAHELILQSSLVVGFASTTLLESGLAGKNIIVPDFEETLDPYYRKHIKLRDFYPLVSVAHSRENLIGQINSHIKFDKTVSAQIQKKRDKFFEQNVASIRLDPMHTTVSEMNKIIRKFENELIDELPVA